jgi:hypothetical protein
VPRHTVPSRLLWVMNQSTKSPFFSRTFQQSSIAMIDALHMVHTVRVWTQDSQILNTDQHVEIIGIFLLFWYIVSLKIWQPCTVAIVFNHCTRMHRLYL